MNAWVNCKIFGFSEAIYKEGKTQTEWVAGKAILKKTRSRISVVLIMFVIAYIAIICRMTQLAFLSHHSVQSEAEITKDQVAQELNTTKRANVYDSQGKLLATSLRTSSLYADPKLIYDAKDAARKLSTAFPDLSYSDLYKKLSSKRRFIWLKRNLTPKQMYMANRLGIPGIDFLDETRRVYPQGALTSHVVGYTDIDNKGLSGIERGLNDMLLDSDTSLKTTIDVRLQHILRREVSASINEFNAIGGAGLIMNVHTGEIEAMVSLPDYNPHSPGTISDLERFNRITLGAYEMGSTFKTFTVAALLEAQNPSIHTRFQTTVPLRRGGFTIRDYHPEKHNLTISEIFMHSSNIGAALIAEKVGTPGIKDFFGKLGLMDKTQLEIKEVAQPILPKPWRDISTDTASYGHGIAVTPIQLATAYATIVNGGYRLQPTLVKHPPESYQNRDRILSERTSQTMRDLLRIVVTDGTASKANIKGYRVGGKTGTAEKTLGRGYSAKAQIASFVGVFPMDAPQYIVLIMTDEPKGNKKSYGFATAGWVAAPYVGNVIRDMAPLVGIRPQRDTNLALVKAKMGLGPMPAPILKTEQNTSLQGGGRLASY